MRIEVRNNISKITGSPAEIAVLDELTSYPIEGAKFSPAFKAGHWDGREHLLRAAKQFNGHLIPTGVLAGIEPELGTVEWVDARRKPVARRALEWCGKQLRSYQHEAIVAALADRGLFTGRGMWNLPIRSGKTLTAAGLIQLSGLKTLFVVSSIGLLGQTERAFKEAIVDCPVAVLGAGSIKTDWITVATAQTLLARPAQAKKLLAECDLLIVDEAHHLQGEAWRTMLLQSDAMYKIGLSATIFVSRDKDNNTASIWLRACCGPILHRVSMDRLIRLGHLKPPNVLFYRCQHPDDPRGKDWQWVARNLIANSDKRNALIADLAASAMKSGKRVLIDTGRHDQMKNLFVMVNRRGVLCETIQGNTPIKRRDELVARMAAGEICLVGTVLGEGIDIPELEVVINAEGQKSAKAAIQRMRNLTQLDGKGDVYFIDIADVGTPLLQKHSLERLRLYRGHRGFKVSICVKGDPAQDPMMRPDK